jgi:hypothetical protein
MTNKKTGPLLFHLFCVDCQKGWHFENRVAGLFMETIHLAHRRLANNVPMTCGPECANDWEMCKNADL